MSSLSVNSAGSAWATQIKTIETAAQTSEQNFVAGVMGNSSSDAASTNLFSALSDNTNASQGLTSTTGTASSATSWQSIINEIEASGKASSTQSTSTKTSLANATSTSAASTDPLLSSESTSQVGSVLNLLA